jgi:cell shape-determining protein MreD
MTTLWFFLVVGVLDVFVGAQLGLAVVVALAQRRAPKKAMAWAFGLGLLTDVLTVQPWGLTSVVYISTVLVLLLFRAQFDITSVVLAVGLSVGLQVLGNWLTGTPVAAIAIIMVGVVAAVTNGLMAWTQAGGGVYLKQ